MRVLLALLFTILVSSAHAQVTPGTSPLSPEKGGSGIPSVLVFGAKCDGTTDDGAKINTALNSGNGILSVPNSTCRSSVPIVIPPGSGLIGVTFNTAEPPTGSIIQCDLNVTPCVKTNIPISGSTSQGGQIVQNISFTRASGTIPAGTVCFLNASFKVTVENVNCNGHAIGFEQLGTGAYGLIGFYDHIWTCNITDSDLVQNGSAEMGISNGRFGCNGTRNATHNNWVEITGGAAGQNGPNTLVITDSQFNDITVPTCFISWQGLTFGSQPVSEFTFHGNHAEFTGQPGTSHSVFCSDSSATVLQTVDFSQNVVLDNNGTGHAFSLNAATALGDWRMHDNQWNGFGTNGWVLAPAKGPLLLNASGNIWDNALVTVTGPNDGSASSVTFGPNNYYGGLAISGNFGNSFPTKFSGVLGGGTLTNTATSPVTIDIPGFSVQTHLTIKDPNNNTDSLTIDGTSDPAGANLKFVDTSSTPFKYVRNNGGSLQFLNSGYNTVLFTLSDVGALNMAGITPQNTATTGALCFNSGTGLVSYNTVGTCKGTLDSTVIGGTTPAAITGTTVTATGAMSAGATSSILDPTSLAVGAGGQLNLIGTTSGANAPYAAIKGYATSGVAGAQIGDLEILTAVGGTLTPWGRFTSSGTLLFGGTGSGQLKGATSGTQTLPNGTDTLAGLTLTQTLSNKTLAGFTLALTTVASLPTCNTAAKGAVSAVSDATLPTYNGTLTGAGTVAVPVFCNGTAWTSH